MKLTNKTIILLAGWFFFGVVTTFGQQTDEESTPATTGEITWYELSNAQELAQQNGKKVLIFAEALWCTYCKRMKSEVFPEADVQEAMATWYYPVKIDIESDQSITFNGNEMTQMQFSRQMQVTGTPTFFFVDEEGSVIAKQPGFISKDLYIAMLAYIGTDYYNKATFEEYMESQNKDG